MNQELYSLLFSDSNQMMPLGEIVRQNEGEREGCGRSPDVDTARRPDVTH